jgi:hypothetical protein
VALAVAAALTKAEDETRERIAADIANEIRRKASTLDKMLTEASGIQSEFKPLSAAADQFTEATIHGWRLSLCQRTFVSGSADRIQTRRFGAE